MANKSYHVLYMTEMEGHTFNGTADKMIGAALVLFISVGVPGNIISLLYFWSKRKDSLPNVLLTVLSAVDACTCILTLPIICSLVSDRRPLAFFLNYTICGVWYVPFYFTLRFSQFMVLVVSVTRTLAILAPFYQVNNRAICVGCVVYAGYILTVQNVLLGSGVTKLMYFSSIASCTETNSVIPPDWKYTALVMNNVVNLSLISVIVFVSFVLSVMALAKESSNQANAGDIFRRASITITIITAVFLVCNLPMFVAELLGNLFFWKILSGGGATKSPFIVWYFTLMGYRVFTPIKAALNPCIYLWRMEAFRRWTLDCVPKRLTRLRKTETTGAFRRLETQVSKLSVTYS